VRVLVILTGLALAGCAASRQEVVARLGDQYVGKNVDALVVKFGAPVSAIKLSTGEMAYVWQVTAVTSIAVDSDRYGSNGTAKTNYCKINVVASPVGIVTQLTTEDRSGTGGLLGLAGVDIYGSICARHLEMKRET